MRGSTVNLFPADIDMCSADSGGKRFDWKRRDSAMSIIQTANPNANWLDTTACGAYKTRGNWVFLSPFRSYQEDI
jgi:hypothetical protein